uniref:Uncharacterized protein n=1 Tax=viral metagenome TaxID=1070528 RepID=A0A2V0R9P3_9ZZZZ
MLIIFNYSTLPNLSSFSSLTSRRYSRITSHAYSAIDTGASNAAKYVNGTILGNPEMVAYTNQSNLESDVPLSTDQFGLNSHSDSGLFRNSVSNYSSRICTQLDLWTTESDPEILTSSIQPKTYSELTTDSIHLYSGYSICEVMNRCSIRDFTSYSSNSARIVMSSINALSMMRLSICSVMLKNSGSSILNFNTCSDSVIRLTCHIRRLLSASIRSSSVTTTDLFQHNSLLGTTKMEESILTSDVELFAHHELYIGGLDFYKEQFIDSFKYIPGECDMTMVTALAELIFTINPDLSRRNIQRKVPSLNATDCQLLSNLLSNANLNVFRSEIDYSLKDTDIQDIIRTNNTVMEWNGDTGMKSTLNQFKFEKNSSDVSWSNVSSLRHPNAMVLNESYDVNNIYYAYVYRFTLAADINTQTMQFCESEYTEVSDYSKIINSSDNYKWLSLVMFGHTFEANYVKLPNNPITFAEMDVNYTAIKAAYPSLRVAVLSDSIRRFELLQIDNNPFNPNDYTKICDMSNDVTFSRLIDSDIVDKSDIVPTLSSTAAEFITSSSSNSELRSVAPNDAHFDLYSALTEVEVKNLDFDAVQMVLSLPKVFEQITAAAALIGERTSGRINGNQLYVNLNKNVHSQLNYLNNRSEVQISIGEFKCNTSNEPKFNIGTEVVKSVVIKHNYGKQFLNPTDIRNIISNVPKVEDSSNPFKESYVLAVCLPTCTGKTTMAKEYPEYLVDIDELINKSEYKDEMARNRNDLFNNHNESELMSYLENESYIITKIVNQALLNGELKSRVLLIHAPMQVREIPQIIIAGCLKLTPGNWDSNISMRRLKAKNIKRFDRNVELAKLGSNEYIEMSQSLIQLVTVLISHKFCK